MNYTDRTCLWVTALTSDVTAHPRYSHPNLISQQEYNTPPPSDKAVNDGVQLSVQSSAAEECPPEYRKRDHDWFQPGRLFKMFAPYDLEIHEKQFVLLDTKNKEGPGLLIRTYSDEENGGYFLRTHVLVQNWVSPDHRQNDARRKIVYLDEYEDEQAQPGMWVELEHTYNIPFATYPCIDCGMLDRESLTDLRRGYVGWLTYHWGLG